MSLPDPPTCLRCERPLFHTYHTEVVSATHQRSDMSQDGMSTGVHILDATSACSWNCLAVLAAQHAGAGADAAVLVVAERERQVTAEGYTPEHDHDQPPGELAAAAMCYADAHATGFRSVRKVPSLWPFDAEWFKPKGLRSDLVRAAALLAAEVDADKARGPRPVAA